MSDLYRIKIKKENFEIEVESTNKEFVLEEIQKAQSAFQSEKAEQKSTVPAPTTGAPQFNDEKKPSLNEIFRIVQPSGVPDTIALITYYKEKFEGKPEVTTKDVNEALRLLKIKSANTAVAITRAKSNGHLMDGTIPKSFVVTNTAEKMIEDKLNTQPAT